MATRDPVSTLIAETTKTRATGLRRSAGAPRSLSTFPEGPDPHGQVALDAVRESLSSAGRRRGAVAPNSNRGDRGRRRTDREAADHDLRAAKVRAAAVLVNAIRESFLLKD